MNLKTNPDKKSKFRIKISKAQEEKIKANQMPLSVLAGLLGGTGGTMGFGYVHDKIAAMDDSDSHEDIENADLEDDPELYDYEVPTSVDFADDVSDDMSFGEAFQVARQELGQGGFFTWKGQHYNTYSKEEWDSFSEEDKTEFFKLFHENTDFENGLKKDIKPIDEPVSKNDQDFSEVEDELEDLESVELEEIGSEDEILGGLNDGEAFDEEDNFGEDIF